MGARARRSTTDAVELQRRGAAEVAGSDVWSGSSLVLVNDAAKDVATVDSAIVDRHDGPGDRLGELQAAVWTSMVVVPDVLGEHDGFSTNRWKSGYDSVPGFNGFAQQCLGDPAGHHLRLIGIEATHVSKGNSGLSSHDHRQ